MLKVGLSVCRVIDFKQRNVQISLMKIFALIFYTCCDLAAASVTVARARRSANIFACWISGGLFVVCCLCSVCGSCSRFDAVFCVYSVCGNWAGFCMRSVLIGIVRCVLRAG